jgi:hypothetical protein
MMINNSSLNYKAISQHRNNSLIFKLILAVVLLSICLSCSQESEHHKVERPYVPKPLEPEEIIVAKSPYQQDANKSFLPLQRTRIIAEPLLPYPDITLGFE